MLLVVDVGNTQTHLGAYDGTDLVEHWRFATVRKSTVDELGAALVVLFLPETANRELEQISEERKAP